MTGLVAGWSGIVTGAARGIGRAIALELGRHGANIAVGYSSHDHAANEVAEQIQSRLPETNEALVILSEGAKHRRRRISCIRDMMPGERDILRLRPLWGLRSG